MLEAYVKYKAIRLRKSCLLRFRQLTQVRSVLHAGHTHPDNRKTQEKFKCVSCGHTDNADKNASKVIKSRAIKLILDTGTVLEKGLMLPLSGRGGSRKTKKKC